MDAFIKRSKVAKKEEDISKQESNSNFNVKIVVNPSNSKTVNLSNTKIKSGIEDVEMEVVDDKADTIKKYQPWVEKYRPNKIDDIYHQKEVVAALRKSVSSGKVPHMLMYGPPGTGKTSTILALAKELYGPEFYRSRVLELNASDDRGIGMVRDKIKKFAQKKITKSPDTAYPCPPVQIIILDEADSMTNDAQAALRRTIEVYSAQTRFCIICNYVSKIIEPLASRCVKFRFEPISDEQQVKRLEYICSQESISYEPSALTALVDVTEGDLRKSIMMLQSAGRSFEGEKVKDSDIYEISGRIPKDYIDDIWAKLSDSKSNEDISTEIAEDVI